jgi:4-hydroxy-tetrahydrodipicolinate reductase
MSVINKRLHLIVLGAAGRMGRRVCDLASKDPRFQLSARLDRENFKTLNSRADVADVLIDFSAPKSSLTALTWAANARMPIVIGVTGFSPAQLSKIRAFSKKIPVFLSPNFSPGVFVMKRLAALAARELSDCDVSILETHHKMKKDAPSGTARDLVASMARKVEVISRRVGEVVGEHTVVFSGPFERLEITHRAHSRDLFACGALEAASWLCGRKPGFYGMADLLEK